MGEDVFEAVNIAELGVGVLYGAKMVDWGNLWQVPGCDAVSI